MMLGRGLGPRLPRLLLLVPALLLIGAPADAAAGVGSIDHIESTHGVERLLFSIDGLPDSVTPDLSSARVTVNGTAVSATATLASHAPGLVSRTTVLVIDSSDSMRGARFAAAKSAALSFIAQAPADVRIGIVSFAGSVKTVLAPSTDRNEARSAVQSLHLSNATHLYKGIEAGLRIAGSAGQQRLVVLTDGRDTTSTPVAQVVSAVRKSGDRVDVVGISLSGAQVSPLSSIADAGRGTLVNPAQTDALTALFAGEATSLARQVLISFPVPAGHANTSVSLQVSVRAGHATYTDEAYVRMGAVAKTTSTSPSVPLPVKSPPQPSGTPVLVLVAGVAAIAVALFLGAAVLLHMLFRGDAGPTAEKRLEMYTVLAATDPESNPLNMREAAVDFTAKVIGHRGMEERLTSKLGAAGLAVRPAEWILINAGTGVGAGLLGYLFFHGNLVLAVLMAMFGVAAPWLFLRFREASRIKAFNSQLADGLQLMAGGLKAGLSMAQSLDSIVREGNEPMAGEFRRALMESQLGVVIEDALENVAVRMKSDDFRWVVMAIRIQHQVGGNLAELLLTVAGTIREREYLRRQVRALSAEGRMSAYVLCGMPPMFLLYLSLTNPDQIHVLFSTAMGIALCAVAGVMMAIGIFWMSRVVKVDV